MVISGGGDSALDWAEFLALMDREAVQAAESQVMAFEAEFTKSAPETQDAEEPTM